MICVNLFVSDYDAAIQFYIKAFGAVLYEEGLCVAKGEGCARFRIGQALFAVVDENLASGSKSPSSLGGVPMCIQLFVSDVEACVKSVLEAGAKSISPSTVVDPFGFVWSISKRESSKPDKARHYWSKEISVIDFFVDHNESKAVCRWQKRNEMLVKKGAVLKQEAPLNKDGSLGFAAKYTLQLRDMNKDKISDFVTTDDIILKSVNEVGNFLYFAGTNSWLVLKDAKGRTIDSYTTKSP